MKTLQNEGNETHRRQGDQRVESVITIKLVSYAITQAGADELIVGVCKRFASDRIR
jgi:hypothetical protein